MRKALKFASVAALGGVLLQFGGCFNTILTAAAITAGLDFFIDNASLIDLFPDG